MNKKDFNSECQTSKTLQIFTVAHAVRSSKSTLKGETSTTKLSLKNKISKQMREELNVKHEKAIQRQPKSHLPMRMIVSKMTTRESAAEEFNRPQDTAVNKCIELAPRSWKTTLEPPSWRNKLCHTKRRQTSQMQRIVDRMKEKHTQFKSPSWHRLNALKSDQRHLDLGCLVGEKTRQDPLSTPKLDHNYNQLYGACHQSSELKNMLHFDGEDPLGLDMPETPPEENQQNTEKEEVFQLSPNCSRVQEKEYESEMEFVWNPVTEIPKIQSSDDQTYVSNSVSPLYHPCFVQEQPSVPDIQCQIGNSDSDSTSPAQTITEERLQLTYFTKKCRSFPYLPSLVKKPCLPGTGTQDPKNSKSVLVDNSLSIFKFLEE